MRYDSSSVAMTDPLSLLLDRWRDLLPPVGPTRVGKKDERLEDEVIVDLVRFMLPGP